MRFEERTKGLQMQSDSMYQLQREWLISVLIVIYKKNSIETDEKTFVMSTWFMFFFCSITVSAYL